MRGSPAQVAKETGTIRFPGFEQVFARLEAEPIEAARNVSEFVDEGSANDRNSIHAAVDEVVAIEDLPRTPGKSRLAGASEFIIERFGAIAGALEAFSGFADKIFSRRVRFEGPSAETFAETTD